MNLAVSNLLVLPPIYKAYVPFPKFMFYLGLNVDLLVLCYIYKFLFYFPVIHEFSSFIVICLFYLLFTSLLFHFQNLCFILQLMLIY